MKTTTPVYLGPSRDQRTNRWRIICPACGDSFEPQTTMMRIQNLICPKQRCGREMVANYNSEPPVVELMPEKTA